MTKFQFGVLVLWLSFTILAFNYFIQNSLVHFDSENKLVNIEHQDFIPHLISLSEQIDNDTSNTIVHFSKANCNCQKKSEAHIVDINKTAIANGFNIIDIVLDKHDIIPSAPSIAIIGNAGELLFFGPYGQGIACSQTFGYAQTILNNYLKGYSSNTLIKDAKGCYCTVFSKPRKIAVLHSTY